MSITISWEDKGLYVQVDDEINYADLTEKIQAAFEGERFASCRYTIFNASKVDFVSQDLEPLKELSQKVLQVNRVFDSEYKFAIVLETDTLEDAVMEYLSLTKKASRLAGVFHSLDAARAWLGK